MQKGAYIEKLVVEGFKSYGTKRKEIPLGEGFIAVVGPNGAGKSNIGDAIAFALGLSTARALRAKNLSHLIFSKDGKKAPYALVEVHFRNLGAFPTDDETVVVSRKVTPDGRSVFRVNGVPVRERDLKDFLARAGIYENAYNVVYQGDIVRFLKHTPLERRRLIEEVAGIGEYEKKKEKALKDLAEVELKLGEIKLLTEEIKGRLDELKREYERLKRHRELTARLRALEKLLLLREREKLSSRLNELREEKGRLADALNALRDELKRKEEQLKKVEAELKKLSERVLPHREKTGRLLARAEHLKEQLKALESEREELSARSEALTKLLEHLRRDEEALKAELEALKERELKLGQELGGLAAEEEELLKALKVEEGRIRVTLEELKKLAEEKELVGKQLNELARRKAELSGSMESLKARLEAERESRRRLEQELNEKLAELARKEEERDRLEKVLKKAEEELTKLKAELTRLERRLEELRREREALLTEKARLEERLSGLESPAELFKEEEGVYGTVAELIRVKDPAYLKAVEVAGGARLKYLVVRDEEVARRCIEKAKRLNLGRFTFLPLNRVRPPELSLRYPRVKGAVDFAVNLVEYDPKLESVVRFVFGDTLVVESFDAAKAIGIGSYRMVTLDGELFERSGAITGGSTREGELSSALLKSKLEELNARERALKEEEERLFEALRKLRSAVSEKEAVLTVGRKKLKELGAVPAEELKKRYEERLKKSLEYSAHLSEKLRALEQELKNLEREELYLRQKLENLRLKEEDLARLYRSVGLDDKRARLEQLREHKRRLEEALSALKEELLKKRTELSQLTAEREAKERELSYARERLRALEEEIERTEEELKKAEEELEKTQREAYELIKKKEELEEELNRLKSEVGGLKLKEEELKDLLARLERDEALLNEKLSALEEELKAYEGLEPPQLPVKEAKEELKRVKEELERLGEVNFRAEEEYGRELERYREYEEKLKKLKEESKAIRRMLDEIERKKKRVFLEAFRQINKNLQEVFAFLSPGGKAKMVLEKPEEPFEGGVLLTVKPRGKDVQYLEAMSGGEKTLAALALIFAVQAYKPSPFYYFDEVDAHLDEANARRVGELIREKSREAQFIVVTLREVVSSFADRVIGVTARGGVSEPVFLKNYALEEVLKG
ncbi:MAG: chromosome segregation protein SMC [Aquificae bacterium]|nr:chromosome segregation protein SMC [Aquificota bacterium]